MPRCRDICTSHWEFRLLKWPLEATAARAIPKRKSVKRLSPLQVERPAERTVERSTRSRNPPDHPTTDGAAAVAQILRRKTPRTRSSKALCTRQVQRDVANALRTKRTSAITKTVLSCTYASCATKSIRKFGARSSRKEGHAEKPAGRLRRAGATRFLIQRQQSFRPAR